MPFTPKAWQNAPSTATPLDAAGLTDLENRIAAYTDTQEALDEKVANKGQVNGYAGLDGTGKVPTAQLPASGSTPNATTSSVGVIQLAGDLGGTATLPTVPGLTAKAVDTAVVHNTGNETVAGVKTFSSSPIVPTPNASGQAAPKSYVDSVGSAGAPQATTTSVGTIQLANHLGGTATAPTVPGLAAKADLVSGRVPTGELGSGAASSANFLRGDGVWATPPGGGSSTGGAAGWYNVKSSPYNAAGDNATDDTAAIQAALDALIASGKGGTLYFPAGKYKVSNLWIHGSQSACAGLVFRGDGGAASILYSISGTSGPIIQPAATGSSAPPMTPAVPSAYNTNVIPANGYVSWKFVDMGFRHDYNQSAPSTSGGGINLLGVTRCTIVDCLFGWQNGYGVQIMCGAVDAGQNDSIHHKIRDCVFENNVGAAPCIKGTTNPTARPSGGYANGQGYTLVEGCHFNGNQAGNVAIGGQHANSTFAANWFTAVSNILSISGFNNRFVFNHMENNSTTTQAITLSAPSGVDTSNGMGTFGTTFVANTYAGSPANFTVTDCASTSGGGSSGFGSVRVADGIAAGNENYTPIFASGLDNQASFPFQSTTAPSAGGAGALPATPRMYLGLWVCTGGTKPDHSDGTITYVKIPTY